MGFSENLQELRKRKDLTQEQLAEKLEVSRQSVSKWESGTSYPEMEKILQICEMFHCNIGVLLQGDVCKEYVEDKANYDAHKNWFSKMIAAGLAVMLFCIAMGMMSAVSDKVTELIMFGGIVVGVMILIVAGLQSARFTKKNPFIEDFYTEEEKDHYEKKFIVYCAVGIGMILLGVLWVIMSDEILPQEGIGTDMGVVIFMVILSIAVPLLVYAGIQKGKYNIDEYNQENNPDEAKKEKDSLVGKICACIMILATAIFLGIGFTIGQWQMAAPIFAIGGLLCGVAAIIFSKDNK